MWKYFIYFCAVQSKLNFWAYIWLKYPSVTILSYALNLNNAQIDSLKIALIKIKHYGSPKYYFHCTLKGWIEDKTGCVFIFQLIIFNIMWIFLHCFHYYFLQPQSKYEQIINLQQLLSSRFILNSDVGRLFSQTVASGYASGFMPLLTCCKFY